MIITPSSDTSRRTFAGTPAESVNLSSVEVDVIKGFANATSDELTVDAPSGRTITSILNCHANVYPAGMSIVDILGITYIVFNATLFFTVELDDGNVQLISSTIEVQGELGATADITGAEIPTTPPTVSCTDTGITTGGGSVYGKVQVTAFDVTVKQLMSVRVVIDPEF